MTLEANGLISSDQLQRLQAVTDAALAYLSVDELLDELLVRVRDALSADTVAILLLDEKHAELVARAAKGLEEEVRERVRIPLGRGFAGTIAATGKPLMIFDVDHSIVMNPILSRKGVRSLLGVPLVVEGRVFGVLHVGTLTPRQFTGDDERFLQMVGDRVALAVHVGLYERERIVARTLQQSFLPERLPNVAGLELAARYRPAARGEVGGDWYDVFVLPDQSVGIAIGDVVGRGIVAATMMARVRNALRAYAMEAPSPSEVLGRLNRLLLHFDPEAMATVLLGVVILQEGQVRYASAGHIPPVFRSSVGRVWIGGQATGPPLGVVDRPYFDADAAFPGGTAMILCTDGLIERRHESIDVGLRRLVEASSMDLPPEEMVEAIMQGLMAEEDHGDDVALMVARAN
jgi:putative methionine-R-sulfoxide reductase with GAF domain